MRQPPHEAPLVMVLALLGWAVVRDPMGALLAIPLPPEVKQILPILGGEPLPPPPARP